jgi:hypothetical protein
MSSGPWTKRKVKALVGAVQAAGLSVMAVQQDKDGSIKVMTSGSPPSAELNPFDIEAERLRGHPA